MLLALLDFSLRGCEPCDRHPERRAGNVVDTDAVEELDRVGISTMLTADSALEAGPMGTTGGDAVFDELAYTLDVDGLERVEIEDLVSEIVAHEGSDIIA